MAKSSLSKLGSLPALVLGGLGIAASNLSAEPLRVAADVGYAPWAMRQPSGEIEGFVVDMAKEVAKRVGRTGVEVVDVNFSAIFAGLFADRYDMIVAPMAMTKERAAQMLFTEGYMTSGLALVVGTESEMSKPEDLKGKILATNSGSFSDTWATENAAKYGYTVQRYDKDSDAMQAVVAKRADANVVNLNVAQFAASKNRRLKLIHRIYGNYELGYSFRKDASDFRNKVDAALECIKFEGVLSKLHEKWFGEAPGENDASMKVVVGYGPIGLEGYDGTFHKMDCKE